MHTCIKQTNFLKLRDSVVLKWLLMLWNSVIFQRTIKGQGSVTFSGKNIEFDRFGKQSLFNSLNYVKKIDFFLHITHHLIKKTTFFYISGGYHAV